MVDAGEGRLEHLVRHEGREALLQPDVVEPGHRHEIPEPHVRGLVRDEVGAARLAQARDLAAEERRRLAVEDAARVLHPREGEVRHDHEVELLRRGRGFRSSPRASASATRCRRKSSAACLSASCRLTAPRVEAQAPPGDRPRPLDEGPGRKGEEVGRDRLRRPGSDADAGRRRGPRRVAIGALPITRHSFRRRRRQPEAAPSGPADRSRAEARARRPGRSGCRDRPSRRPCPRRG